MTGRGKCKRKRSKKSKNSSSSSTNSEATPKRIKEAPSMSTASVGEDSVFVYSPVSEPPTTLPSDPLSSANMADQVEMTETEIPSRPTPHAHPPPPSIEDNGTLLDNKLGLFRLDLLNKVKAVVKTELRQVTDKLKEEIDKLRGTMHDMQLENETLKNELVKIRSEREIENDNIISAKHRSIENDQYARRTNIVIYGIKEKDKENTVELVRETIKDKLKMSLNKDEIEVCHRLSPQTRGKVRPIVVRFRFRDTKWDVMKCRKKVLVLFSRKICAKKCVNCSKNCMITMEWSPAGHGMGSYLPKILLVKYSPSSMVLTGKMTSQSRLSGLQSCISQLWLKQCQSAFSAT